MKMTGVIRQIYSDYKKLVKVEILTKHDMRMELQELQNPLNDGKEFDIEIKVHRKKRSLDANAMLWVILGDMADVLQTSKDELYIEMLERYGLYTHIIVKPNLVDKVKKEWRTVRVLGDVLVNGQTGTQLQCYFGSSTYDSKEFSVLLDGVISEAKEIGVQTATPDERDRMIEEWAR